MFFVAVLWSYERDGGYAYITPNILLVTFTGVHCLSECGGNYVDGAIG